ncbi:MAG: hypothetical protein V2A54_15395 [Bacteroidota bacterium]
MNHRYKIFLFLLIAVSFAACRKDVDVPDPSLEKLFGKWQLVGSCGGIGGASFFGNTEYWIELNRNGIFKGYDGNTLEEKREFNISIGHSIYTTNDAYLIKYHTTKFIHRKYHLEKISQSIEFFGEDTLWLLDEAYDAYSYCYVRKK